MGTITPDIPKNCLILVKTSWGKHSPIFREQMCVGVTEEARLHEIVHIGTLDG